MFNSSFFNEAKSFIHRHSNLIIDFAIDTGTFVAQLAGRIVRWIKECVGTAKKVNAVQQAIVHSGSTPLSNSTISISSRVTSAHTNSSTERTQGVALSISATHAVASTASTSRPSTPSLSSSKSGYVLEEYYSPIAANGDHLKVEDIDPHYLFVTYDNYAFDIRDVVDFVVRISEGDNINPHKTEDIADRALWKPRSLFDSDESYNSFVELSRKEQEILGTDKIRVARCQHLESEKTKNLQKLKAKLQPTTISTLKELSYVLSQEGVSDPMTLQMLSQAHLIEAFFARHDIASSWDSLAVRTMALIEMKELINDLPPEEREALFKMQLARHFADPTVGTSFAHDFRSALEGTGCAEYLGTSVFIICEALETV